MPTGACQTPIPMTSVIILHVSTRIPVSPSLSFHRAAGRPSSRYSYGCLKIYHQFHDVHVLQYEICDVTIDAKTPFGDAVIEVEGAPQKLAPVSSYLIFAALHMLEIRTVEKMLEKGYEPRICRSGNIPGGDEFNAKYINFYKPFLKDY
jgi:hypothetical protein